MEDNRRYFGFNKRDSKEFKVKKIIEYFVDKNRIDVTDLNFESALKLDKMIYLFNEERDLLKRYYYMKTLFKSSNDFNKEYKILSEYTDLSNVCYLYNYVIQISEFMSKIEEGMSKEREKELLSLEKDGCFDDYPYAQYFVREFVNYKDSPYLKDFLEEKGLYEHDFNRFITTLLRLDDSLYDEYLKKENENRLSRQSDVIRKLENIRSGVTTGFTKDGEKFDDVEFYRNIPFYDQDSSRLVIDDFGFKKLASVDQRLKTVIDNLCGEDASEVVKFIYSNRLMHGNPKKIREEEIINTRFIVNDQEISSESKQEMIDYMKERNIPFLQNAFAAVKNKYLTEGLNTKKEKELKR